jgi:hypothetical protein
MDIQRILQKLKAERAGLIGCIRAFEDLQLLRLGTPRRGRPPKRLKDLKEAPEQPTRGAK